MNFKNLNGNSIHHHHHHDESANQPSVQQTELRPSIAALNGDGLKPQIGHASNPESVATADTVVRWTTVSNALHSSPENSSGQSEATVRPGAPPNTSKSTTARSRAVAHEPPSRAEGLPDDRQMPPTVDTASAAAVGMFEFDPDSPPPISEDTPYIRFAVDQITRDGQIEDSEGTDAETSANSLHTDRVISDGHPGRARPMRSGEGPPTVGTGGIGSRAPAGSPEPVEGLAPVGRLPRVENLAPVRDIEHVGGFGPIGGIGSVEDDGSVEDIGAAEDIRPVGGTRPSRGTGPIRDTGPVEGIRPVGGPRPVEGIQPIRGTRPFRGTGPIRDSGPVEGIWPVGGPGSVGGPRPGLIESLKPQNELFIPVKPPQKSGTYSNLRFKPTILRTPAMTLLMILCASMVALLLFCAIYSDYHRGLVSYDDGLTSGRHFVFQFLPQILAAGIFVYVECVTSAVARVLPFTMMASDDEAKGYNALFTSLYTRSLLWPRFDYHSAGEPVLFVCNLLLWPIFFTIPLQSSLFSVINVDGAWRWATIQGAAWTLVAIYLLTLVSLMGIWLYFLRRRTGLIWDYRSVADIVTLLPQSNFLDAFQDTEVLASRIELSRKLFQASPRLGYWRTNNPMQKLIYCIGEKGTPIYRYSRDGRDIQRKAPVRHSDRFSSDPEASPQPLLSHGTNSSLLAKVYSPTIRFRHIPWFLNDSFILLWPISATSILITMFIVSFLPSTALQKGFSPLIHISTDSSFTTASFIYSFIPSLLGMFMYTAFQSITLALARLTPWAVLSNPSGAKARESILLDYAASAVVPFSGFATAISNRHYLVAFLLILTPLTLLLPMLGGGIFFPLQAFPSMDVLIFTNMAAYGVILAILVLCAICVIWMSVSLLSHNGSGAGIGRRRYYLAHPVTCLGEIISFLYASDLVRDAAFRAVRNKADLTTRLMRKEKDGQKYGGQHMRYTFGIFKGDDDRSHLGVSKLGISILDPPNLGTGEEGRSRSKFSI